MKKNRIYSEKVEIKTEHTKDFYNSRAKALENLECPYTAVLLGDQNPKYAEQWNIFEKEYILPMLKINSSKLIDIGCGIGRWAETVIPLCEYYLGTDFSEEMINTAKGRNNFAEKKYDFIVSSFQDVTKNFQAITRIKFDRVIIGGVCMYINDADLSICYNNLLDLLDEHCIMYFTETVAVETRLTLDECPSEALKTNYDVIYRTPSEYNEYYKIFLDNGFKITKQDYLPHLNSENSFKETDRWYTILER